MNFKCMSPSVSQFSLFNSQNFLINFLFYLPFTSILPSRWIAITLERSQCQQEFLFPQFLGFVSSEANFAIVLERSQYRQECFYLECFSFFSLRMLAAIVLKISQCQKGCLCPGFLDFPSIEKFDAIVLGRFLCQQLSTYLRLLCLRLQVISYFSPSCYAN